MFQRVRTAGRVLPGNLRKIQLQDLPSFLYASKRCSSMGSHGIFILVPVIVAAGLSRCRSNHHRHRCSTAHAPITNEEGRRPFQAAAEEGNIELVQLLAASADVNAGAQWRCQAIDVTFSNTTF